MARTVATSPAVQMETCIGWCGESGSALGCRSKRWAVCCVQAMVVLLTVLVRTSVVDAQHVWEYLARNNTAC